ncbi:acid--CoA ligase [Mycolicibacterium chitae]|uniref:2-succinylbenzoate--CoA ligase n=1 Tax=Mycolicibacterium chitae TaxID=1792 RepID=A0A3S4RIW3_MYCCI|nr:AMP-binding protein [Mycolicibacterium chitae]MCV7105046.1 AMP-binding protein [Mycolicibacterium chitae]BBZ05674.1 acid--CoA ligase [Mycolicibacterium chitae]VEG49285.1 2-succinylbenzoate--CoA ligase [Mycolicibacterium chitae]
MTGTVVDALTYWARARPTMTAIDFAGDQITYAQLAAWADAAAHDLAARGVGTGDRVGFLGANSLEWCAAALGAFKVGAIAAPFNPRLTAREIGDLVADCEPVVVYGDAELRARLAEVPAGRPDFTILGFEEHVRPLRDATPQPFDSPVVDMSAPTAIVFTSGTTGRPKGVVFTPATIAGVMREWELVEGFRANELRTLLVLPLFSAAGIIWGISRIILNGGTLFLQPRFDPATALEVLTRDKANTFTGPPILFEQIARVPGFDDADLSHMISAHVGGARVPVELLARWTPRGVALRQLYGQTEIGGTATVTPRCDAATKPEKCGWGTMSTKIRVVDTAGNDCPPNEPGEILLRGPGMMPGYWRNDDATRTTIVDGWLHTGDLGVLDEHGYLTFVDRLKDMIISGGLNISPAEIENIIGTVPGVEEVAVFGVDDDKFGETPAAVVRADPGVTAFDVVQHCNRLLADYKVPRYVVVRDQPLPRQASGKIAKRDLRSEYADITSRYARVR